MKRKPYMIKALISIEELNKIEENVDVIMQNNPSIFLEFMDFNVNKLDDLSDIMIELDEKTIIIFADTELSNFLVKMSKKLNVDVEIMNITEEIFNNEIKLSTFPEHLKNEIQEYIIEQYGQNDVLDKILGKGVESITETDELILKQKTPKI